jgi:hypothetical protein
MDYKWFYHSCYRAWEWVEFYQLANSAYVILHLGVPTSAASVAKLTAFTAFQHVLRLLHVSMDVTANALYIRTILFSVRIKETIRFSASAKLQKFIGHAKHVVRLCSLSMLLDPSCPIRFNFCSRQKLSCFFGLYLLSCLYGLWGFNENTWHICILMLKIWMLMLRHEKMRLCKQWRLDYLLWHLSAYWCTHCIALWKVAKIGRHLLLYKKWLGNRLFNTRVWFLFPSLVHLFERS